jgi:hypothetical protein
MQNERGMGGVFKIELCNVHISNTGELSNITLKFGGSGCGGVAYTLTLLG